MKPPSSVSDPELFHRAGKSRDAFEVLYRAYSPAVYAWFRRHVTSNPAEAADLTAELFARAILSISRFRGNRPGSGTAWLFGIAHHLAADFVRTERIESRARSRLNLDRGYDVDPAEDADLRIAAEQSGSEITAAFEMLTAQQQTAIQMRVIGELPYNEIARRTGSTSQASRLHVMRGLRRLRELVFNARQENV